MKKEKSRMILNNRPQVQNLNKANEAWSLHSENTVNVYTVILCTICVIIAVLFFINQSVIPGLIFLAVAGLLAVVAVISIKHEKREHQRRNQDKKDAVFKDHEE